MRRQYRVLAALSAFFNVLGVVTIIAGIGIAAYVVYAGLRAGASPLPPVLLNAAVFLLAGVLGGLLLWALGQLLRLMMDMAASARQTEINTRATAKLLQRQLSRPAAAQTRVAPQSSMPRSPANDFDDEPFSFIG